MKKIIRFRPLDWENLKSARFLKPFEALGLVEDFSADDNLPELAELICDVSKDYHKNHYRYDHLLYSTRPTETPSTLFAELKEKGDRLPTLWAYTEGKDGRRKNIHAIKDHRMLQSMAYALEQSTYAPEKESDGE